MRSGIDIRWGVTLLLAGVAIQICNVEGVSAQQEVLPPEVSPSYTPDGQKIRRVIPGHVEAGQSSTGLQGGVGTPGSVPQNPTPTLMPGTPTEHPTTTHPPVTTGPVPEIQHRKYVSPGILVTTTSLVEGFHIIQYKGLVEGAAVREPTWNQDASAGLQEPYGGSLDSYAQMCEEARVQSYNTLVTRAKELGANAVVGVHFDSQSFMLDKGKFATAVVCVGTAVVVKPNK